MKLTDSTPRTTTVIDPLASVSIDISAVAEIAMGRGADGASVVGGPHLATLSADTLCLDLSDPAQRQFGDYELLEQIGEGGMGVVYRARQHSLDREVAIKLLAAGPWASSDFIERFRREAQSAARMQHPNIVAIYEVGAAEGLHFFSMRLVHGGSLAGMLKREGKIAPMRAAQLLRTIAEAVDYAHRLGVLHLDLKPANVLLDEYGQPHVADFGLARRLEHGLAADNFVISGTPSYMAPEQALAGQQHITPATDVWGLGAIGYELVTGRPPYLGDSPQNTLKLVVAGPLRSPRELDPGVPRDLASIIEKCMARDANARYLGARELADDLGRFLDNRAVRARPLNAPQRLARWMRREPRLTAAFGAVFLTLAAGLIATTLQWRRAQANAERAQAVRDFLVGVFGQADPDANQGHPITAHQLLEFGEQQIGQHTPIDANTRADLFGVLGKLYWDIGDYPRAESLLGRALDSAQRGQTTDRVMAGLLLEQSSVQNEQNKYKAAIAGASRALTLFEQNGNVSDANAARRQIAYAWIGSGKTADAERLLRSSLAVDRAQSGDNGRAVADDEVLLGQALLEQSRLDESVAMSRDAIATIAQAYGPKNAQMLTALGNLGVALRTQGKYAEAEKVLRQAVQIATGLYGPDHSTTLTARSDLLLVLDSEGRYAEALKERVSMLPMQSKLVPDHPEILAYTYKNIAGEQFYLGRFADAAASAEKALAIWKGIEGSDSEWHSVTARNWLALALQFQGRYADAESEFRATIAIQRQHEPTDSVWLALTYGYLGNLLRLEHSAVRGAEQIRSALTALPDKTSPVKALLLADLSEAELDAGMAMPAKTDADAALAMARKIFPAGNFALATPLFAVAKADLALSHFDAAMPLLREAKTMRDSHFAADDPRTLEIDVTMIEALAATGQKRQADKLAAQIEPPLAALRTPFGADLRARLRGGSLLGRTPARSGP